MSEETKLKPCFLCGDEPSVSGGSDDYVRVDEHCCPVVGTAFSYLTLEDWNKIQERGLVARRADFEAGIRMPLQADFMDRFYCAHEDITCSEFRDRVWDDYLKTRGKS